MQLVSYKQLGLACTNHIISKNVEHHIKQTKIDDLQGVIELFAKQHPVDITPTTLKLLMNDVNKICKDPEFAYRLLKTMANAHSHDFYHLSIIVGQLNPEDWTLLELDPEDWTLWELSGSEAKQVCANLKRLETQGFRFPLLSNASVRLLSRFEECVEWIHSPMVIGQGTMHAALKDMLKAGLKFKRAQQWLEGSVSIWTLKGMLDPCMTQESVEEALQKSQVNILNNVKLRHERCITFDKATNLYNELLFKKIGVFGQGGLIREIDFRSHFYTALYSFAKADETSRRIIAQNLIDILNSKDYQIFLV